MLKQIVVVTIVVLALFSLYHFRSPSVGLLVDLPDPDISCPPQPNSTEHLVILYSLQVDSDGDMSEVEQQNFNYMVALTMAGDATRDVTFLLLVAHPPYADVEDLREHFKRVHRASPLRNRLAKTRMQLRFHQIDEEEGADICNFATAISEVDFTGLGVPKGVTPIYLFVSSTMRGPFLPLPILDMYEGLWYKPLLHMFKSDPKVAMVGMSWDCNYHLHVPLNAFALNEKGLRSAQDFYKRSTTICDKKTMGQVQWRRDNEAGLSRAIMRDYSVRTFMEPYYHVEASSVTDFACVQGNANRAGHYFGKYNEDMLPGDTMFVQTGGDLLRPLMRSEFQHKRLSMHSRSQLDFAFARNPPATGMDYNKLFGVE